MASHSLELVGAHTQALCTDCHQDANFEQTIGTECADCHEPPGESHYGSACEDCHTPDSFQNARLPNHPVALEGFHEDAPCAGCHADGQPTPEYACSNCHERPENHLLGECSICHTPEGWVQSISFVVDLTPPISHGLDAKESCLMCHELDGQIKPAPSNHGDYIEEQCVLCHK